MTKNLRLGFNWHDFNLGIIVNTPDGKEGILLAVDKIKNKITLSVRDEGYRDFNIEELQVKPGQINLGFCNQVGKFILHFQRFENRLRDFLNYCLSLNKEQAIHTTNLFTAGKLIKEVTNILKKHGSKDNYEKWKKIENRIGKISKIRNTITHGYLSYYNKDLEFDFNSPFMKNPHGHEIFLSYPEMQKHIDEIFDLYYEAHQIFGDEYESIKNKIQNS